ncbi:MAG: YihY/virulence factor BrkB family protein [Pseudomonadota bacterium]
MQREGILQRLKTRIGEFLFEERRELGVLGRGALNLLRLANHLLRQFIEDLCPQRAAAMAYTTVLSLVPVTALFVLYFKTVGKLDAYNDVFQEWVLRTLAPESAQNVTVYLDRFVSNMHTKALGTFGAAGLIVSAYLLFRTIERSLNDIWKIRTHRSFLARFQILSSLVLIVPAFLFASLYVTGMFQRLKFFGVQQDLTSLMRTVFLAAPFLLTILPFFIVLKWIPNTRVRWRPALIAAAFCSVLFEFVKSGFNFYVMHVLPVNKIYGALGLVPILLIWIYFSWVLILFGVELAYTIQNLASLNEQAFVKRRTLPLDLAIHEEWGLRIVTAMVARFVRGEGAILKELLAQDVGLRTTNIEDHLSVLVKARIVSQVDNPDDPGFVFTQPIDRLTVGDVANAYRTQLGLSPVSTEAYLKPLRALIAGQSP